MKTYVEIDNKNLITSQVRSKRQVTGSASVTLNGSYFIKQEAYDPDAEEFYWVQRNPDGSMVFDENGKAEKDSGNDILDVSLILEVGP